MSDERDNERDDVVVEPEVVAEGSQDQQGVTRQGIKVAELGRRPKLINLDPDEEGRTIQNMIERNQLRDGMEYFVNGQQVQESAVVLPGDAVVAVPRIRGG